MSKFTYFNLLVTLVFINLVFIAKSQSTKSYGKLYQDLPFKMEKIVHPIFPDLTFSLLDYGGVGDGINLNSDAFSKAIDALAQKGGGTLNVPGGIWLTGPNTLKSNINLHLEEGAFKEHKYSERGIGIYGIHQIIENRL